MSSQQTVILWDWPVRLSHWLLVLGVIAAYITAELGGNWIDWHGRIGLALIGVLTFRVCWGLWGSPTARFARFVRGPSAIAAYLRGHWQGIGHNPLGALSVLALLGAFLLQAKLGLFSNDDIAFNGPLYPLVSKEDSDWLTGIHRSLYWWLIALVGIHLAAILYYRFGKRENLVGPMLHGRKEVPAERVTEVQSRRPRWLWWLGLMMAIAVALGVVALAAGMAIPPPPPPLPTPAW